jgi:hypothetical protein
LLKLYETIECLFLSGVELAIEFFLFLNGDNSSFPILFFLFYILGKLNFKLLSLELKTCDDLVALSEKLS